MQGFFSKYHLFCLDFDGLLVDTERLHFLAYTKMLDDYGCHLSWDFSTYVGYAHLDRFTLRDRLFQEFPQLQKISTDWEHFRQQKQRYYEEFLHEGKVQLMPGVIRLLRCLQIQNKNFCVVTNSPDKHLDIIQQHIPFLQTVPLWIGRRCYAHPKPAPDPYLAAMTHFPNIEKSEIIALEDTIKGSHSARSAGIDVLLICDKACFKAQSHHIDKSDYYFPSLIPVVALLEQKSEREVETL